MNLILRGIHFFGGFSVINRLIGLVACGTVAFGIAVPDIRFHSAKNNKTEFTFAEFIATPADKIPRYIKIKDGVVPANNYVISTKKERLQHITYPVATANSGLEKVKVIVKDSAVTQEALDDGTYFSSPTFAIEGRFNDTSLDLESQKIYKDMGYVLDDHLYLIERGSEPIGFFPALGLAIVSLFLGLFIAATFIPASLWNKYFPA
ncbi:hypothetical protein CH370_08725 [Leptospira kmetyi]|uniref:Uncharacterized protein n=1 Tax=Leptospira kmetyi TaxID=408139 RepID=A0A2M9XSL8_9LEPT|nr:hypothetical protein [Leptospira kmetyi]AYV56537.1 hypothetical protein EFP84_14190 [Leptospira kmetyi]PJZ42294.1 hypothetical protein CH370_08725 [Leptospira kmetyi]TGL71166.1 hypothetical protein EHQ67_04680 [Leptospira kmetyi]